MMNGAIIYPVLVKTDEKMTIKSMAKGIEAYNANQKNETIQEKYNYIAVLEIPKINLKQGLVDINNKYNTIQENIQIINDSMMPDTADTNLILAAHNGNSKVSFFKNLDKLSIGDMIYLYYNNNKYLYKIDNIYEVLKKGSVNILRDENKTTITLITCKNNDNYKQNVYIGYLVEKYIY